MGCIYIDNLEGICTLCDNETINLNPQGAEYNEDSGEWECVCEDDEDPGYMCESYESDWVCSECGADLNIEECDCDNY